MEEDKSDVHFDYFEYQRYLQLTEKLELEKEMLQSIAGGEGCTTRSYTDDSIKRKMCDTYGQLDFNSEDGLGLFKTYKEGLLNQYGLQSAYENKIRQMSPEDAFINVNTSVNDTLDVLTKEYSTEQVDLYNQNPFTNKHQFEYFVLPRQHHVINCFKLKPRKTLEELEKNKKSDEFIRRGVDLRIFDPRMEVPDMTILPNFISLSPPVCMKLAKLMLEFPIGVQADFLVQTWYNTEKYRINTQQFGISTFLEFMGYVPDIFWITHVSQRLYMAFSTHLKGFICDMELLSRRLWSRIAFAIDYYDGELPLDKVTDIMGNLFQIDIKNYKAKLMQYMEDVYSKLFPHARNIRLDLDTCCLSFGPPFTNTAPYYFHVPPVVKPEISNIFARHGDCPVWMAKLITPGPVNAVPCIISLVKGLSCFYIQCIEQWKLDRYMADMNFDYNELELSKISDPHPSCLRIGLYVAVCVERYSKWNAEYRRAVIIKIIRRKQGNNAQIWYKVFLIDYGHILYVTIEDIKYLYKEHLTQFPAQAIECRGQFNPWYSRYASGIYKWSIKEIGEFFRRTANEILGIYFIRKSFETTECKRGAKWFVTVCVVGHSGEEDVYQEMTEFEAIMDSGGDYVEEAWISNRKIKRDLATRHDFEDYCEDVYFVHPVQSSENVGCMDTIKEVPEEEEVVQENDFELINSEFEWNN